MDASAFVRRLVLSSDVVLRRAGIDACERQNYRSAHVALYLLRTLALVPPVIADELDARWPEQHRVPEVWGRTARVAHGAFPSSHERVDAVVRVIGGDLEVWRLASGVGERRVWARVPLRPPHATVLLATGECPQCGERQQAYRCKACKVGLEQLQLVNGEQVHV